MNKKMATLKADAVNEGDRWYAVVYEQWEGYDASYVHRDPTPYDDKDRAAGAAFRLSQVLAEHYQGIINRELSKTREWLEIPFEERVRLTRLATKKMRGESDAT